MVLNLNEGVDTLPRNMETMSRTSSEIHRESDKVMRVASKKGSTNSRVELHRDEQVKHWPWLCCVFGGMRRVATRKTRIVGRSSIVLGNRGAGAGTPRRGSIIEPEPRGSRHCSSRGVQGGCSASSFVPS